MGLTPNDSASGRSYSWDEETYVSVTTVLNVLHKPAIAPWASKMAAMYVVEEYPIIADLITRGQGKAAIDLIKGAPWRKRDKAADLGTTIHHCIEAINEGKEYTPPDEVTAQLGYFANWVDAFKPDIHMSEGTIFNKQYNYAGTLDIVARIDGLNWLIDVKSGSGVYPEHAMQIAAYARGEFIGYQDGSSDVMPIIDKGAVLHIRPTGYAFVPVSIAKEVFDSFLYCREMFRWVEDIAPHVILPEVRK